MLISFRIFEKTDIKTSATHSFESETFAAVEAIRPDIKPDSNINRVYTILDDISINNSRLFLSFSFSNKVETLASPTRVSRSEPRSHHRQRNATKINSFLFNSSSTREIFLLKRPRRDDRLKTRNADRYLLEKEIKLEISSRLKAGPVKLASNISSKITSPNSHSLSGRWWMASWQVGGVWYEQRHRVPRGKESDYARSRRPNSHRIFLSLDEEKNRRKIYIYTRNRVNLFVLHVGAKENRDGKSCVAWRRIVCEAHTTETRIRNFHG